jgi:hypothetical protein
MARSIGGFDIQIVGPKKVLRNLELLKGTTTTDLGKALVKMGENVIGTAKDEFVPKDFGVLANSGHVRMPTVLRNDIRVDLGFGGPAGGGGSYSMPPTNTEDVGYALAVHENPRAGKTGGVSPSGIPYKTWSQVGGWKYLERALGRHIPFMVASFRKSLNAAIKARWP